MGRCGKVLSKEHLVNTFAVHYDDHLDDRLMPISLVLKITDYKRKQRPKSLYTDYFFTKVI